MAAGFKFISWNATKVRYDLALVTGVIIYLTSFVAVNAGLDFSTERTPVSGVIVRGLGSCAFLMLTIILTIGPPRASVAIFQADPL